MPNPDRTFASRQVIWSQLSLILAPAVRVDNRQAAGFASNFRCHNLRNACLSLVRLVPWSPLLAIATSASPSRSRCVTWHGADVAASAADGDLPRAGEDPCRAEQGCAGGLVACPVPQAGQDGVFVPARISRWLPAWQQCQQQWSTGDCSAQEGGQRWAHHDRGDPGGGQLVTDTALRRRRCSVMQPCGFRVEEGTRRCKHR
jgi:hypothetical protein